MGTASPSANEKRTYASLRHLASDLASTARSARGSRDDRRQAVLSQAFRERLMLCVTQVNGCRWCSFAHSRMAIDAGLRPDEVKRLLNGCVDDVPEGEATALLFAQHWAEAAGRPEPEARARLVEVYGPVMAGAIERVIGMINTANLVGNTFDRVMSRLTRGRWTIAIRISR